MVWIVGDKGMLGMELSLLLRSRGVPFVGSDRDVDILDPSALSSFAKGKGLRWIVNCAAYTAVDRAEDEETQALRINAEGPKNLASLATDIGARLLHLSTDYIFAGDAARPYEEDDPIAPRSAYGRTKAEGEAEVRANSRDSVIIRTSWLYGKYGTNFVHTMLRLMGERDSVGVVDDQAGTPTWSADLAAAIVRVVAPSEPGGRPFPAGIYHYAGEGQTTWYRFALAIYDLGRRFGLLERECSIAPLTTAQYPTKARRPAYSVLSKDKIRSLGIPTYGWEESLRGFFARDLAAASRSGAPDDKETMHGRQ